MVGAGILVSALFTGAVKEFDAGFAGYQRALGWNYYRSQERGFAIQFPDSPVLETGELYIAEAGKAFYFNEYKSFEASGAYYTVSYIDFPVRWRFVGANKLLTTALDLLISSEEGVELVAQARSQHRTLPAIDFEVRKGEEVRKGRLILFGNTFYKVMRVSPQELDQDPHFEEFLQSFLFPKT